MEKNSMQIITEELIWPFIEDIGGSREEFKLMVHTLLFEYHGANWEKEEGPDGEALYAPVDSYFARVVMPHKVAVFKKGMEMLKNPNIDKYITGWQKRKFRRNLLLHDMSKFSPEEAFGYAMRHSHPDLAKTPFELAWHHHKMHNPHHPEYWMDPNRQGHLSWIPMPKIYILEMIADWLSKGEDEEVRGWMYDNIGNFKFNPIDPVIMAIRDFMGIPVTKFFYKVIMPQNIIPA